MLATTTSPLPLSSLVMHLLHSCKQSFLTKPSTVGFVASIALSAIAIRRHGDRQSNADARLKKLFVASSSSKSREKVAVDKQFVQRIWRLLKIMCPGVLTPEFGYAVLVASMLVRTRVAANDRGAHSSLLPVASVVLLTS
jgi:hypothetical protein